MIKEQLIKIVEIIKQYPQGALLEDIVIDLPRRTLQRRLSDLQKQGIIKIIGRTKGSRYLYIGEYRSTTSQIIPLSTLATETLQLVTRTQLHRIPVGYNQEFLLSYQPNITRYLTLDELDLLAQTGRISNTQVLGSTYNKEILNRLLIDLAWSSSRLEGNTYSLLDTERLIRHGEHPENKSLIETQMILNHKDAIEFISRNSSDIDFNRYTILNIHDLLAKNLLPDPASGGRLRQFSVGIAQSVFEPLAIPQKIIEMFDMILQKLQEIQNPFEQSFFAMVHLPYLQPFDDVNKRVSRLAANIPFIKNNLVPLSFLDVPTDLYISGMLAVYELNRIDLLKDIFIWAYDRSSAKYSALRQSLGEPDPFRFKYSAKISSIVSSIVKQLLLPKQAASFIKNESSALPDEDQIKFEEIVDSELLSLHEGNLVRHKLKPSEFSSWKKLWE